MVLDKALRSPFHNNLEEIGGAYEIKEFTNCYDQETLSVCYCCVSTGQAAYVRILSRFFGQGFSRQDFELCYMDTALFYLAMIGDPLDEIVRPEMKQTYEADKKNWLATDKFSKRTPAWLTAKCYLNQNEALNKNKYSCKGVSQEHNGLHFQRYKNVLDVFLKTRRYS